MRRQRATHARANRRTAETHAHSARSLTRTSKSWTIRLQTGLQLSAVSVSAQPLELACPRAHAQVCP
eukprot:5968763-Pleurochrysis_carterae.AAC.1